MTKERIEELKQILHDEKMKLISAETKVKQKEIEQQEAKDKELFKLRYHWTGQKANLTDVKNSISPPRSEILKQIDSGNKRLEAHYNGIVDGFKIRIGFIALCILVYVI